MWAKNEGKVHFMIRTAAELHALLNHVKHCLSSVVYVAAVVALADHHDHTGDVDVLCAPPVFVVPSCVFAS